MKKFVVQNAEGQFLRVKRSSGYKTRTWVEQVGDATLFNRKSDASQTTPMVRNPRGLKKVVEVEVEVRVEVPALLASRCQGVAHTLTYNDGVAEAEAKHTLLEASHCLDTHAVRVRVGAGGGVFISNARGKSRVMTWRERLAYRLLGGSTEIRP